MHGSDKLVYGLGPLYVVKADGSTVALARDGGKSVRAEVSSTGAVSASFRYRAYGQIVQWSGATSPSYLGYAGQLVDPSGLLYMRARWYDPATGRFITRDPVRGDAATPASLNAFGYAYARPTLLADPAGTCPICLIPVAIWIGVELGLPGFEVIDTAQTLMDSSASVADKGLSVGGLAAGVVLPGGGYGFGAKTALKGAGEAVYVVGRSVGAREAMWSGKKLTNELAQDLGVNRRELGRAVHKIKDYWELAPDHNVTIGRASGDVYDSRTGELLGNIFDELGR